MKRHKHSLSHYVLSSFDMGNLIPVGHFEVLPGDSVRMSTSCLLRCSPLVTPPMHPVSVRIHHWFVPYRLLWDDWEDFITGGPDGEGAATAYPTMSAEWLENELADYLGIPPLEEDSKEVSAFPFRAYSRIWNEFYRDQDLDNGAAENNTQVLRVSWEKDYFTTARPWPQKGPDVTLPLGTSAPVVANLEGANDGIPRFFEAATGSGSTRRLQSVIGTQGINWDVVGVNGGDVMWSDPQLVADLSTASAVGVNDVRLAFALQRYQEARAQYGSRYSEYLRYLGVRSSDARLQRPEYLGGGRATISFSEVLRTGNSDETVTDAPIGQLAGHGISGLRSRRWIRFFEEHGIVMALASVRPRSMYASGLHRSWSRRTKEDYWQKELEQIGQQEIRNDELFCYSNTPDAVFGYQDRYAEYRHLPSYVTSNFRSTLDDWHFGRFFASQPVLNNSFTRCNPAKRPFADQVGHSLLGMFSHSIQARRMVTNKTIGRIF